MNDSLCYLDGKIIKLALNEAGIDGFIPRKMTITFSQRNDTMVGVPQIKMKYVLWKGIMNIIRVVLQSEFMRHSTVLFVNLEDKKIWWWNPMTLNQSNKYKKIHAAIKTHLRKYLEQRLNGFSFEDINLKVDGYTNSKCQQSGMCNAYVLKYIIDSYNGVPFDGSNISEFAQSMHEKYKDKLVEGKEDIEFNFDGAVTGGVGGALVGGLLGGGTGALIGGVAGASVGGLYGNSRYDYYDPYYYDPYYVPIVIPYGGGRRYGRRRSGFHHVGSHHSKNDNSHFDNVYDPYPYPHYDTYLHEDEPRTVETTTTTVHHDHYDDDDDYHYHDYSKNEGKHIYN